MKKPKPKFVVTDEILMIDQATAEFSREDLGNYLNARITEMRAMDTAFRYNVICNLTAEVIASLADDMDDSVPDPVDFAMAQCMEKIMRTVATSAEIRKRK